ncbi:MAG: YihY/virulence factor BrkB family protein [Balneolaceae bacterium]
MKIPGLGGEKLWSLLKKTFRSFFQSDMDTYAAAVAFQMLFAIFPFIIVFIAILGVLDLSGFYQVLYDQSEAVLPGDATELIDQVIDEIEQPTGALLPLAILAALWLSSSAMRSATHALNIAYRVEENRPFWSQFLLSVVYTLGIAALLILALFFMITGPQALEWIAGLVGLDEAFILIWTWLRWPVAVVLLILTVGFIYYAAPNAKQKFRQIIPGSILSVLVWIGISIGFDFYMRTFVDLSILYGSIGAIIFLLLYFYISAAVLLFGAKLNAVISHPAQNISSSG